MAYINQRPSFKTTLSQQLAVGATEAFIDTTSDDQGNNLDGLTFGFIINEGLENEEQIIGTFDTATGRLTGLIRDVDFIDGATSNSTGEEHDAKSVITMTAFPTLTLAMRAINGDIAMGGVISLPSARTISNARDVVDKEYADALTVASFTDFATTDAGGLDVNVAAGTLSTPSGTIDFAGTAGLTMTDNTTNYVEIDENGSIQVNTTGWVEGNSPIAKVVTASGDITSISLTRGLITIPLTDNTTTDDYTYGDTIAVGQIVYMDTADAKWKLADGSAEATATGQLGIALEAGVDTDTGKRVQLAGVVTGLSGLTPGWQYVSDTAGELSSTAGTYKKLVGYAPNATTLIMVPSFSIEQMDGVASDVTTELVNTIPDRYTPVSLPLFETITADDPVKIFSDSGVAKARKIIGNSEAQATGLSVGVDPYRVTASSDKVFVIAEDTSKNPTIVVGSVAGNQVTFGTPVNVYSGIGSSIDVYDGIMLSETEGVIFMGDNTPSSRIFFAYFTVSGTTVTAVDTDNAITDYNTGQMRIAKLTSKKAVTFFADSGSNPSYAVIDITSGAINATKGGTLAFIPQSGAFWNFGADDKIFGFSSSSNVRSFIATGPSVAIDGNGTGFDVTIASAEFIGTDDETGYLVYESAATAGEYYISKVTQAGTTISESKATLISTETTGASLSISLDSYGRAVVTINDDVYWFEEGASSFVLEESQTAAVQSNVSVGSLLDSDAIVSFDTSRNVYVSGLDLNKLAGFVQSDGVVADERVLIQSGAHAQFTGLEAGREYFLQNDGTLGLVNSGRKVGDSLSSTSLAIRIDNT